MSLFSRRIFSILSSQAVILVISLATGIFLSRSLGKELKGQFDLVSTFAATAGVVLNLGIGAALIYYTNRNVEDRNNVISSAFFLQFISALIGVAALLLAHAYIQGVILQNKVTELLVYIGMVITPLATISSLLYNLLVGLTEFGKYNVIRVTQNLALLVGCILLVGALSLGVLGALSAIVLANLIVVLLSYFWLRQNGYHLSLYPSRRWIKSIVAYGSKSWLGYLLQFMNLRLDIFLVNFFLNTGAVAIYSVAVAISETLWYLPTSISTVLFPKTATDWEKAKNFTPLVVRTTLVISILCAIAMALFGKPVIRMAYGEQFAPAIAPLVAILPGTVMLGIGKIISTDLAGLGKPQYGTWGSAISLVLTIIFDIWLIPKFGATGAALASTISYGINTLILVLLYIRHSGNQLSSLILIQKVDWEVYQRLFKSYRMTMLSGLFSRK